MTKVQKALNIEPDDLRKMKRTELLENVQILRKSVKSSLKRLHDVPGGVGTYSPAYRAFVEHDRPEWKIDKNTNVGTLQRYYKELKHYRELKTITLRGWHKMREDTFGDEPGFVKDGYFMGDMGIEGDFWTLWTDAKQSDVSLTIPSDLVKQIVEEVSQKPNMTFQDKKELIRQKMGMSYEQQQEQQNNIDYWNTDDYFEIDPDEEGLPFL